MEPAGVQDVTQPCGALSTATAALWGKTGPNHAWHPLAAHLVDTVSMAQELWVRWISPATCSWLSEPFELDLAATGSFFAWLAGCHDIGKASPAFQIQVPWMHESLQAAGFEFPQQLVHRSAATTAGSHRPASRRSRSSIPSSMGPTRPPGISRVGSS